MVEEKITRDEVLPSLYDTLIVIDAQLGKIKSALSDTRAAEYLERRVEGLSLDPKYLSMTEKSLKFEFRVYELIKKTILEKIGEVE